MNLVYSLTMLKTNKTEHAVLSYSAGKSWMDCNATLEYSKILEILINAGNPKEYKAMPSDQGKIRLKSIPFKNCSK